VSLPLPKSSNFLDLHPIPTSTVLYCTINVRTNIFIVSCYHLPVGMVCSTKSLWLYCNGPINKERSDVENKIR
jgi:hypothetical protein